MLLWTKKGRQKHPSESDFVDNTTASRLEAFHQRHANRNEVGDARWYMHSGGCTNTKEETTQANQYAESGTPPNGERLGFIRVYV